jgi:hypothetical protein
MNMREKDVVVGRYPEAEVVEEVLPHTGAAPMLACCWFVYDGPDVDARVLGRGVTEDDAWADAARRLSHARARIKMFVAD